MSDLLSMPAVQTEGPDMALGEYAENALYPTLPTPFSALITALFGQAKSGSRGPVLFTAIEQGAGVTWTTSAVAAELAASGRKVLLAEAGVLASLSPREDVVALCDQVGSDKVWVLGTVQARGAHHPISSASSQPAVTLATLREEFPYILLDAPALSDSSIALKLVLLTAGAVLVIRENKTEKRAVMAACQRFNLAGGQVLGCVYNTYE